MAWNLTGTVSDVRAGHSAARGDAQTAERALSVSEALARAKGALEAMTLVVEGEVSQFKDSPAYKAVYFPSPTRAA